MTDLEFYRMATAYNYQDDAEAILLDKQSGKVDRYKVTAFHVDYDFDAPFRSALYGDYLKLSEIAAHWGVTARQASRRMPECDGYMQAVVGGRNMHLVPAWSVAPAAKKPGRKARPAAANLFELSIIDYDASDHPHIVDLKIGPSHGRPVKRDLARELWCYCSHWYNNGCPITGEFGIAADGSIIIDGWYWSPVNGKLAYSEFAETDQRPGTVEITVAMAQTIRRLSYGPALEIGGADISLGRTVYKHLPAASQSGYSLFLSDDRRRLPGESTGPQDDIVGTHGFLQVIIDGCEIPVRPHSPWRYNSRVSPWIDKGCPITCEMRYEAVPCPRCRWSWSINNPATTALELEPGETLDNFQGDAAAKEVELRQYASEPFPGCLTIRVGQSITDAIADQK